MDKAELLDGSKVNQSWPKRTINADIPYTNKKAKLSKEALPQTGTDQLSSTLKSKRLSDDKRPADEDVSMSETIAMTVEGPSLLDTQNSSICINLASDGRFEVDKNHAFSSRRSIGCRCFVEGFDLESGWATISRVNGRGCSARYSVSDCSVHD